MASRFFLFVIVQLQIQPGNTWDDEARFKLNCPQASCWHYWNGKCYCLETDQKKTWTEALKFCKTYRFTELVTFASTEEKNRILDLPLDNFWTGLNNLEETDSFSWSEGTRANMRLPWLQLSHPIQPNTVYCVKVSKHRLIALDCNAKAHWICKRTALVDRYQEHKGKVLLSSPGSISQVHSDLVSAKAACLELREQCTGITIWNNSYALARGTVLIKSEESHAAAYVKSDCSLGYFGRNCSSVCSRCYGDELCNPYTGVCDNFHSCRDQDSPAVCEQAQYSVWCPRFQGWKYWRNHCYYFSTEAEANWMDAQKQCRRFRSTDLLWIESKSELDWIFSAKSSEILWTGLNSRKQYSRWVWSNTKSAAKELRWLKLEVNTFGRCVGLVSVNQTALTLKCEGKYKWICKRKEVEVLFDVYIDQFLSGPLEPIYYVSLPYAVADCLSDSNCTGIVQDYRFYRRTRGIDEIDTYEEAATTYVRRECSFGYYGYNCASVCKKCYGNFRCNSVTGGCPERMQCIGQFKGELCELGIMNPKCPQNAPWWFYHGHCYYFEKERKRQHAWASMQCSYYKDGNLAKIDSVQEKEWVGIMLESEGWIGLLQGGTSWKWSGGTENVDPTNYRWLWDFPETENECALMMRGGRLQALPCTEQYFYICEKEIAGLDLFIDYPGKIMLAVYPLAVYKDLDEARFHCVLNINCTGITSWPEKHFLVKGMEMVSGSAHHIFRLKTSCSPGRHGYACEEECPICRENARCNMLTGFCDEKSTCIDQESIETCSETTVSERCPDMIKWYYWNRHCYYFLSFVGSWEEGNTSCSRFRAAELLWIEDEDELKWLQRFLRDTIWIGLQDINYDNIWAWSHEDDAAHALEWIDLSSGSRWQRCAHMTDEGVFHPASCDEEKSWVCKRPAERDLDVYTGFWDSVVISEIPSSSANYTYNELREECIKQMSACIGYGLWQYGYFILNGPTLVGGGFSPSITFLKSACDYGYYGRNCEAECPHCHWDKPCHPITGLCEGPVVCAVPQSVGTCTFGLYSLKCSLGAGWWYWQGNCYLIEKNRKVTWKNAQELCKHFKGTRLLQLEYPEEKAWLKQMISEQMWIGMQWHSQKLGWLWGNGEKANTEVNWLKIEGDTHNGCGTLLKNKSVLQSAKCSGHFYFICQRPESVNIFQEYKSHIIPQRQKMLPRIFYSLESAQEECIFEKTTCTGVVLSQGKYYMVSGKEVFESHNAADMLYLKSVCNPGFYGTNCQFKCKKCSNNLPCHAVTGACVATVLTKCSIDSPNPKCIEKVSIDPCPKKPQWYYFSKSCYYVEDTKKATWANARIACEGFKGTDLVKITNSHEKMWVQYQGDDSWIGLTFNKQSYQYLWVDKSSSAFQNAWVVRRNRRYTQSASDCGVAFRRYLSVTDCSQKRKWICKRKDAVYLFTEHNGRAFYLPTGNASKYPTLVKATQACLALQTCTGVVGQGTDFRVHSGMDLYNTRDKKVVTWIKSDCAAGRFGEMCEQICHKCDDGVSCNPHTGLCGDSLFCSKNDPTFTCEKGTLIGGRCPVEDDWIYWHGNCYYIPKAMAKQWLEARDVCRRYRDTDLLWITSNNEKKFLLSTLPRGTYWTGLHGNIFCTHLQWSNTNVSYVHSEWLHKSWTFLWNCCVHLFVPRGLRPISGCNWRKSWICKKREEETMDFRTFGGYYLVGIAKEANTVTHKSLNEAFQHCRFQRRLCTGVQRIRTTYITYLAKRMVLVSGALANVYTAYLKSACSPGYYGPECSRHCICNGTENCNPLTGQCAENEQCNEDYLADDCEKGMINLKCPTGVGWWYWKGNCYYVETINTLTWDEAKKFCMAYHETELIPLPRSKKEKIWLASMLKGVVWIGSAVTKAKDRSSLEDMHGKAPSNCRQMNRNGILIHINCSSLAAWVCKRSVDANMFWKYPRKMLILPLGDKTYENKEHAKSACLLEEKCTGISYWRGRYIPVSGKELIIMTSEHCYTYMKTACSKGYYGNYCQEKCPECSADSPCNRLTGECAGEVSCPEKKDIYQCEFKLRSAFCYHSWTYFNGYCYYIPKFGKINKTDAEYMCSQYDRAQLIRLTTPQEKEWLTKITSAKIWLKGLSPTFPSKMGLPLMEDKLAQRDGIGEVELCLQLDSKFGYLMSAPCSHNASWVCEAPLASKPVDAPDKWWVSLVISLSTTIVILVLTVFLTFKYGFWLLETASEVKPQP